MLALSDVQNQVLRLLPALDPSAPPALHARVSGAAVALVHDETEVARDLFTGLTRTEPQLLGPWAGRALAVLAGLETHHAASAFQELASCEAEVCRLAAEGPLERREPVEHFLVPFIRLQAALALVPVLSVMAREAAHVTTIADAAERQIVWGQLVGSLGLGGAVSAKTDRGKLASAAVGLGGLAMISQGLSSAATYGELADIQDELLFLLAQGGNTLLKQLAGTTMTRRPELAGVRTALAETATHLARRLTLEAKLGRTVLRKGNDTAIAAFLAGPGRPRSTHLAQLLKELGVGKEQDTLRYVHQYEQALRAITDEGPESLAGLVAWRQLFLGFSYLLLLNVIPFGLVWLGLFGPASLPWLVMSLVIAPILGFTGETGGPHPLAARFRAVLRDLTKTAPSLAIMPEDLPFKATPSAGAVGEYEVDQSALTPPHGAQAVSTQPGARFLTTLPVRTPGEYEVDQSAPTPPRGVPPVSTPAGPSLSQQFFRGFTPYAVLLLFLAGLGALWLRQEQRGETGARPPVAAASSQPSGRESGQGQTKVNDSLLRSAAELGDLHAMLRLGTNSITGNGVPKDAGVGVRWIERAARGGLGQAMYLMGVFASKGLAPVTDSVGALDWYRRAVPALQADANAGDIGAALTLGDCYRDGTGVLRDSAEAVTWYRKAAEAGQPRGERELGLTLLHADTAAGGEEEGYVWLTKAARDGDAVARDTLTGRGRSW